VKVTLMLPAWLLRLARVTWVTCPVTRLPAGTTSTPRTYRGVTTVEVNVPPTCAFFELSGSFSRRRTNCVQRHRVLRLLPLLCCGGGDGWLRAYDAASGREVWRFDGNPKDARWLPRPGVLSRSSIIASPVFADGRVFIAMGQSPGHGDAPSLIHAISPNGQGDVTESRLLWTSSEVGRVVGTPIAKDGLLYVGDLGGMVHCLDAATGTHVWKHDAHDAIWGCLLLAGDRLYVGTDAGSMTVLRAGRRKELLARIEMDAPLYSRPALVGDALYLATPRRLYLIAAKP
jgi:outer membrane protein assembly factor BamB